MNRNKFKELKKELEAMRRSMPKDYRRDYEIYDCHFFQGFFPELTIEECMEFAKREHIVNDRELLEYVAKKIFSN